MISGPLNKEGMVSQLSILETNETHPATISCQVTCLDQHGIYFPAMTLIITSQEQLIEARGSRFYSYAWDGLYSVIYFRHISSCEAQNNYTMEFEYLIYSNSSKIDRAVLQCGVVHSITNHPCWGLSYGIIRYESESAQFVHESGSATTATNPESTQAYTRTSNFTHTASTIIVTANSRSSSISLGFGWLIYTLISITVLTSILLITVLPLTTGFLYMRSRRRNVIIPQCVQTVEQTLVTKVKQSSENAVKEKETSLNEEPNCSPVQVQIDQKLPDTISSRNIKTF